MKFAVAITLDGLVRAMRWNAHELAEAAESGHTARAATLRPAAEKSTPGTPREDGEYGHDLPRR